MASLPLLTIVIPVYNRADIVCRTLDSVELQTFRPLHVILVDNGSTDNTLSVLNDWKQKAETSDFTIEVLTETSPGACNARNKGLESVKSPYMMFFDSDDEMFPNHIERAMEMFKRNPDADIVGWDVDRVMLSGKHRRSKFATGDSMFNHIFHAGLATQRYACRTELIRRVGAWDNRIVGWVDYELGVRLLLQRPNIVYAGKELSVLVHSMEQSITGVDYASNPEKWEYPLEVCSKHLKEANEKDALKWIEVRRIILAGLYHKEGNKKEGRRLKTEVLDRTVSMRERLFYKFVYRFVALGGRGVAILVKLFL